MEKQVENKLTPTPTPTPVAIAPKEKETQRRVPEGLNINIQNMQNVQFEIQRKKYSEQPYYATEKNVVQVITDYDELPYKRWYRGVPESNVPIVAEREAGYRPLIRKIYIEQKDEPEQCFEHHHYRRGGYGMRGRGMRGRGMRGEGSRGEGDMRGGRGEGSRGEGSRGEGDMRGGRGEGSRGEGDMRGGRGRPLRDEDMYYDFDDDNGGWDNIDNYTKVMLRTV